MKVHYCLIRRVTVPFGLHIIPRYSDYLHSCYYILCCCPEVSSPSSVRVTIPMYAARHPFLPRRIINALALFYLR